MGTWRGVSAEPRTMLDIEVFPEGVLEVPVHSRFTIMTTYLPFFLLQTPLQTTHVFVLEWHRAETLGTNGPSVDCGPVMGWVPRALERSHVILTRTSGQLRTVMEGC